MPHIETWKGPTPLTATQAPHPLDYAPARLWTTRRPYFKSVLTLFAICGVFANIWFVYRTVEALHQAHWAHHELTQNSRAYDHEIARTTIASLQNPRSLWIASSMFIFASAFGLLLAIHLLRSTWEMDRSSPHGWRGIARYRRCKPFGILATAIAFFYFASANHDFWCAATDHVPIGSGPPVIETALLALCAFVPWWWIGKQSDGGSGAEITVTHSGTETGPS